MKYIATILSLFVVAPTVLAQQDTLLLEELRVVAPRLAPYTYGAKVKSISSANLNGNLSNAIAASTATYFKDYGNGQLSTISFRGTTAAHTSVLWNGMDINSPTLGLTDFSLIPSYLLDEVNVQFGGASALYGSGAVGGVLALNRERASFNETRSTQVHLEYGSFNHRVLGAKFKTSSKRLESNTSIYAKRLTNNFTFDLRGSTIEHPNAGVGQTGLNQQLSFLINEGQWLEFDGLWVHNHREIQQPTTNLDGEDEIEDNNLYLSLNYYNELGSGLLTIKTNYLKTNQEYNVTSITKSQQWGFTSEYDLVLNQYSSLRVGGKLIHVSADNNGNLDEVSENRFDGFISMSFLPKPWWKLSVNLRQSIYSTETAPLSPSLGQEFRLINHEHQSLLLKSAVSRSYRIPTLNDRYWFPVGNPDLLSEDAFNIEKGLQWNKTTSHGSFGIEATKYYTYAKEWIIWLPDNDNLWSPRNLRDVNIDGWEIEAKWSKAFNQTHIDLTANYNNVKSINQKGLSPTDPTGRGKQLPYTPKHALTGQLTISIKNWTWNLLTDYTGLRYSTLDNTTFNSVEGYFLSNWSMSRKWSLGNADLNTSIKINNLTDSNYQNIKNYAMPGRHYQILINLNL